MATKTISVDMEAYERLRAARERESESFSKVIKRAEWPRKKGTAAELLRWRLSLGDEEVEGVDLDYLDEQQANDLPIESKWDQ
ncbi:antitoxin VapB family protein [Opitutaceae bacterium]|nr:antitoxin VapB family protein [Opitutaceae bacterium]